MKLVNTITGSTVSVDDETGAQLLADGGWSKPSDKPAKAESSDEGKPVKLTAAQKRAAAKAEAEAKAKAEAEADDADDEDQDDGSDDDADAGE